MATRINVTAQHHFTTGPTIHCVGHCLKVLAACVLLASLLVSTTGCSSLFKPKRTPGEKAILDFRVEGISIGSAPKLLGKFPQVQALSGQPEGTLVFQVFNPNTHISTAIFTYEKNHLKAVELRYFTGPGIDTLGISGGWDGILHFLTERYGPPSEGGPHVPVVATLPGLNPHWANFNGEWIFSRVDRQFNYIAQTTPTSGMAAINIQDTTPPASEKKKEKRNKLPTPPKDPVEPNPGF